MVIQLERMEDRSQRYEEACFGCDEDEDAKKESDGICAKTRLIGKGECADRILKSVITKFGIVCREGSKSM